MQISRLLYLIAINKISTSQSGLQHHNVDGPEVSPLFDQR